MAEVMIPKSVVWIRKSLSRARRFETQKIAWKIFFLERRQISDEVVVNVSQKSSLLLSIGKVCIKKLSAELANRSTFLTLYDATISQKIQELSTNERARQLILRSKLFAKTLCALYRYHTLTTVTNRPTHSEIPINTNRDRSAVDKQGIDKMVSQKANGGGGREGSHSSLGARRIDRPSALDSVFVGSLSKTTKRNTLKVKPAQKLKNRPGQRARRQQAEETYGASANHIKGKKLSQFRRGKSSKPGPKYHSNTQKQRPMQRRPPSSNVKSKPLSKEPSKNSEQLHPSWVASKRRKEMEKHLPQPQGQRIVFNDSD